MKDTAHGVNEWWVVFTDRPKGADRQFHHWFVPRIFSHVWAYTWHPDTGIFLTIDPRGHHLFIQPVPVQFHPNDVMLEIASRENTRAIIHYVKPKEIQARLMLHGLYSCVSVIKDLLGINRRRILTPRALARHLVANGGRVIFQEGEI